MRFVNRVGELAALEGWSRHRGASLCIVWGRRRVGKTALLQKFARGRRTVFHTGARRPRADELRMLSDALAPLMEGSPRDLRARPFADWDDALETLAAIAAEEPLLVVLDEFPELVEAAPELPSVLRANWDRIRAVSELRLVLSGSAVRTMESMLEERAPLYGRADLVLAVHPFRPHEASAMLPRLKPAERALVWGLVGGVPLYLSWWDQEASVRDNLARLVTAPGGPLLTEGQLVLATEGESGELGSMVLRAIATGRTRHGQIADAVRAEPARTLDRLIELRLVERIAPVTEDPRRSRRKIYRVADNYLAFWLSVIDRYRSEIERGLGGTILTPMLRTLDDLMGDRWEEAVRMHLRRLAAEGALGEEIVAVGPWWSSDGSTEIDAVVLAGRGRVPVAVAEAKWARTVDARRIEAQLVAKSQSLPVAGVDVRTVIAARERVRDPDPRTLTVIAADVFD